MRRMKKENGTIILLIIFVFFLLLPVYSMAAEQQPETVTVTLGKTAILTGPTPMKLIRNSDETKEGKIIEVKRLSPEKFQLRGKSLGFVTLKFEIKGNQYAIYDIEVIPDIAALKYKLHKFFPEEKKVEVRTANNSIMLSGSVSNAATLSQVLAIAGSYAPGGKKGESKLINLLEVGGVHQVMLEVRISEMSKSLGRKMGVNFAAIGRAGRDGALSFVSLLGDTAASSHSQWGVDKQGRHMDISDRCPEGTWSHQGARGADAYHHERQEC